jgi:polysaccharide pyruvyl transferase WcaK-like protein
MGSVLLAGAFGQRNPGDEALLRAFVQGLPDHDLVATSVDPVRTESAHGIEAVESRDVRAVARRVTSVDGVVLAGGTIFKTLHPAAGRPPLALLRSTRALALGSAAQRVPLAGFGLGVGALQGNRARALARGIVRRCDLLVLRDEESAALLARAGAPAPFRVGADPAWTLVDPPAGATAGGDAVIVALSHLAGGAGLARRLAHVLEPVVRAGLRVRLQPWQVIRGAPDDLDLARMVAGRLDGDVQIVPPPAGLADARDLFVGARLVVALRFHALTAAAAAGVPFVAVAHEAKLAGLGRRLGQPVAAPAGPPEAMGQTILRAIDHPPAAREAIERETRLARDQMALLRVLLSGGRSHEAALVGGLELAPEAWVAPPPAAGLGASSQRGGTPWA